MAIKRTTEKPGSNVPATLSDLESKAFYHQQVSDVHGELYDHYRKQIVGYFEHNEDNFNVDLGKGFKTAHGSMVYTQRANWAIDMEAIEGLIEKGKITLHSILQIAKINPGQLKTMIGDNEFAKIAENKSTEYLTLKANAEFKSEVRAELEGEFPEDFGEEEEEEETPKAKAKEPKKESRPSWDAAPKKEKAPQREPVKGRMY